MKRSFYLRKLVDGENELCLLCRAMLFYYNKVMNNTITVTEVIKIKLKDDFYSNILTAD